MTPNDPPIAPSLVAGPARGADEFNHGLFAHCHETLEELWVAEEGAHGNA